MNFEELKKMLKQNTGWLNENKELIILPDKQIEVIIDVVRFWLEKEEK